MAAVGEGRPTPLGRSAFVRFVPIQTRWEDNDVYGHLNNVVFYSYFDTAVNALLVEAGLLDPTTSSVVGLVVESNCSFFASLAFPDLVEVGVAVEAIGRSSVRYRLGVFRAGSDPAAAQGGYTHVYVERATQRPTPVPEGHRRLMEALRSVSPG
jgi:acyl-CoA thioester hydrolase